MQNQKIHSHGMDGSRYFWEVKTNLTAGEYRSRHATAKGVRSELQKSGHIVGSIKPARA